MTHVFHLPDLRGAQVGASLFLGGDEGHHAVRVRRIKVGETIEIVDGAGTRVRAVVDSVGKSDCAVEVASVEYEELLQPRITIVQALTKKDRSDQVIELLTAVGVDAIIPWRAHRSQTSEVPAKWPRIIVESCKQSRQARFPELGALVDTAEAVEVVRARVRAGEQVLICHERAAQPIIGLVRGDVTGHVIVIGPEGGLADDELAAFADAGAQVAVLGPTVLRAATAGAVAAAIVAAAGGRWLGSGEGV